MNNLTEQMQKRLDKWRQNTLAVPSINKITYPNKTKTTASYGGKKDYSDVGSIEEWEEEIRRSQTYRR